MAKILIALGGNALETTNNSDIEGQRQAVSAAVKEIASLIEVGNQVIITHGNGPQVGRILLQNEITRDDFPPQPLDICGSMTQGFIGYMLQNSLKTELTKRNLDKEVATVVTQVVVDKHDPAFNNPTKPIGSFVSEDKAKKVMAEKGHIYKEDSGRGWRRVVASPIPKSAVELKTIETLINADIVSIISGGGGIPVVEDGGIYTGIEAVIDKDLSAAMLAEKLNADYLIILTAVDKVSLNFNQPDQTDLTTVTIAEAESYAEQGHFAEGSMLPKVMAAVKFVKNSSNKNAKTIITSLENAHSALTGDGGTTIVR